MRNPNPESSRYHLHGFELTVFSKAYLVEVRAVSGNNPAGQDVSRLPDWVFRSHHAIWLANDEPAALPERAVKGDRIRQALSRLSKRARL